jgi:hypothetical protein
VVGEGEDVIPARDAEEPDGEKQEGGPLSLVPGGVMGVAAVGVVTAGIAASVLRASRGAKRREKDKWEDEEGDGDQVEAVYQAGPGKRPATG